MTSNTAHWLAGKSNRWLLATALWVVASVQAQPIQSPRELRLASSAPAASIWARQVEQWAKNVDTETGGQIRFQLFLGGKLGPDTAVVHQVASGRIDIGTISLASASMLAPELLAVSLPMQYRGAAEIDCVIDSGGGALVRERLLRKGLHTVAMSSVGSLQIVGRQAFREAADLAGLKAATTGSRFGVLAWLALGANPVQISGADMPSAFETGLISVGLMAPAIYLASGINKLAPVITMVDLYQLPSVLVVNKGVWDGLSAEHRAAIERARMPPAVTRKEVRDAEEAVLAAHVQAGGQVAVLSEAQHEVMRSRLAARYPEMIAETGPDGPPLHARIEEIRRSCEKSRRSVAAGDGRAK